MLLPCNLIFCLRNAKGKMKNSRQNGSMQAQRERERERVKFLSGMIAFVGEP